MKTMTKDRTKKPIAKSARPQVVTLKNLHQKNVGIFLKDDPEIATIYVGNLSFTKTEYEIKDMYKKYGEVNYVRIVYDKTSLKSQGIAFVQMKGHENAEAAIKALNGAQIDGRSLKTSIAVETKKKVSRRPAFRRSKSRVSK